MMTDFVRDHIGARKVAAGRSRGKVPTAKLCLSRYSKAVLKRLTVDALYPPQPDSFYSSKSRIKNQIFYTSLTYYRASAMNTCLAANQALWPTIKTRSFVAKLLTIASALLLAACGGHSSGGDTTPPTAASYSIGGNISGLSAAGLVLQNNAGDNLTVAANSSSFQFATSIAAGGDYSVTVATQPTGLTCTVSHGVGSNVSAAVTGISVVCSANTYTISGTISGLTDTGLVLRNNGADNLSIAANAVTFQFNTPIAAGSGYSVTAFTQPTGLTCTINNGTATNVNANVTHIHIVCSATTFTIGGTISDLTGNGLVLQNNSGDNLSVASNATTFEFATPVAYGGGYAVTVLTQPSGLYCSLTSAAGTASAQVTDVALTCSQATLTPSVAAIALSVNNTIANAALTGNARQIAIVNNGSAPASNLSIAYPTWPNGTTASSTCAATLAPSSSCTITITPGNSPTSNCNTGVAPTPGTITISADDAPTTTVDAVVLTYGCIYQQGFIYSLDDTTATTQSIGGKVAALNDQAEPYINSGPQATSIIWSSNGTSSVSSDIIPGVDETATSGAGSPTYATAQSAFNATYLNTGVFPFPSSSTFTACNGGADGACNSANILALYDALITNFNNACDPTSGGGGCTLSAGITPRTNYAAGQCSAANSGGYADWYLPAACEMGPASNGSGCAVGAQNMTDNLPFLLGDPSSPTPSTSCSPPSATSCLAGYYWSSTQSSANPRYDAWSQYFTSSGGSAQIPNDKSAQQGIRCSRSLTH